MTGSDKIAPSVAAAIGNTPLVELSRNTAGMNGRILMKLESLNPGFSKKDRAALRIIEEAEASGNLKPGQTVLELTSGNMGTGLAIVCGVKGYPFIAVMSTGNSPEGAAALSGDPVTNEEHPIQGGGYAMESLSQPEGTSPDGFIAVSSADAIRDTGVYGHDAGVWEDAWPPSRSSPRPSSCVGGQRSGLRPACRGVARADCARWWKAQSPVDSGPDGDGG